MDKENRPKILFLNTGWMKHYNGPAADDPTIGNNFKWLHGEGGHIHGHECHNFSKAAGLCFGHHPGFVGTDVQRLGGSPGATSVDGVLVIWFSRSPRTKKAVIVGWYKNATVYWKFQKPKRGEGNRLYGDPIWFKASARFDDCTLLPDSDSDRSFPIPNRYEEPGGYGQSPNWYGLGAKFLEKVWKYVQDREASQRATSLGKLSMPPRNDDPFLRVLVEQNAIRVATEF